jgi:hypothetical protein
MQVSNRQKICFISQQLGLNPIPDDWRGVDAVIELIEKMRKDGTVVIIKFDGEREEGMDNGPYTVLATGKLLNGEYIKIDSGLLEDGLAYVIGNYAEEVWGINL